MHSVERAEECNCGVLCSRPVSVKWVSAGNQTKQNVDRTMSLEDWVHKCLVIFCEWFLKFLWVFCFNYWLFQLFNCSVKKCCYVSNRSASLLQYVCVFPWFWWFHILWYYSFLVFDILLDCMLLKLLHYVSDYDFVTSYKYQFYLMLFTSYIELFTVHDTTK